ncbi:MAG TPA: HAD family hydrolase [Geodermatophilus sp.]|nr:HAD family hydrolase [Geodermatophilus sp.]
MALHPLVTFDLFSALIDSRTGGSAVLGEIARAHGWDVDGGRLYGLWDAHNKASQRDLPTWVPFTEHCRRALAAAYVELRRAADADDDTEHLLASVGDWPLWPDVDKGLPAVAAHHRVGILSNVDDAVLARTRVGRFLGDLVDDAAVLTSERLRAYKPAPEIYLRAREQAGGDLVHVATSARDVRGAVEAGIEVVRLRRPGHHLDPAGPAPRAEAGSVAEVGRLLEGRSG